MSIYFNSDPTDVLYSIPVNNTYTISYNVSGLSPSYVNFWFVFSSDRDIGNGVIVGPFGPTSGNPTANWNGGANRAIVTSGIAQITFYYPSNSTTDSSNGKTYNPSGAMRTCSIFAANGDYSNVAAIFAQILEGSTSKWGLAGEFTDWGGSPDIPMRETFPKSGIFTARLTYNLNAPSARQFKIRINETWVLNYGSPSWPAGNLITDGPNITATSDLLPMQYYLVTANLNNKTFTSELFTYVMCFKQDSTILCLVNGIEKYVVVQEIRKGDLVKTLISGFVPVNMIGTSKVYNPANKLRGNNRLYRFRKEKYPELSEDLIITGCHSILVESLTEEQIDKTIEISKEIFVTDNKYRLMACLDERAEPYEEEGTFDVWHLALDHEDECMNYGIFANGGLLLETTSKRMLSKYSGMELIV